MLLRRGVPTLAPSMRGRVVLTLPPLSRSRQRFYSTPNNVPPVVPADVAPVVSPPPVGMLESIQQFGAGIFESVHTVSGLPYWGVIVGTTVAFRLVLAPLLVQSIKQTSKMEVLKPQLEKLQAEMRMAGGHKNRDAAMKFQTEWAALRKQHDFSLGRQFAPILAQIPLFLFFFTSISYALRSPALALDMSTGGALWFHDLTQVDSFLRLNVMTAGVMFLSFKLGAEMGNSSQAQQSALLKVLGYVFPALYLPLTYSFGQGLHLFWLSSSVVAIAINYALRKTALGVALGIPKATRGLAAAVPPTPAVTFTSKQEAIRAGINPARLAKMSREKHDSGVKDKN